MQMLSKQITRHDAQKFNSNSQLLAPSDILERAIYFACSVLLIYHDMNKRDSFSASACMHYALIHIKTRMQQTDFNAHFYK